MHSIKIWIDIFVNFKRQLMELNCTTLMLNTSGAIYSQWSTQLYYTDAENKWCHVQLIIYSIVLHWCWKQVVPFTANNVLNCTLYPPMLNTYDSMCSNPWPYVGACAAIHDHTLVHVQQSMTIRWYSERKLIFSHMYSTQFQMHNALFVNNFVNQGDNAFTQRSQYVFATHHLTRDVMHLHSGLSMYSLQIFWQKYTLLNTFECTGQYLLCNASVIKFDCKQTIVNQGRQLSLQKSWVLQVMWTKPELIMCDSLAFGLRF